MVLSVFIPIKISDYQGEHSLNSIPLDIFRFRAETMPQIKRKRQGGAKLEPTRGE